MDDRTEAILRRTVVAREGMTLDQLGQLLSLHPVKVEVHQATDHGLDEFHKRASEYLATKNHFVRVNYLRKSLGQEAGGHISPLAAYDAKADRFLILDVRPLGACDRVVFLVVAIAEIRRPLDSSKNASAVDCVRRRYGKLSACVVDGKAGSVCAPIDKPVQLQEVQIAVDADRRGIVESELNRPVDNRCASLSRARVVWASEDTLVLTFHHEITDAVSSIRILSDPHAGSVR